ncbi:hypothetical protein EW146_g8838 [Bondarzewia mesenterica]|uniref:Uncharacterized protein n=1 Tax=Bondarzewia mesenterica TaxID=1095465 RepID=A0A4S4LBH4_9AGAM|nr:hypothetical protein EW146_g8838 [Bondarzewia mesenterica]
MSLQAAAFPIASYTPQEIRNAFSAIRAHWPSEIRGALYNAAFGIWKPFLEVTEAEVRESLDTNVTAAFAFAREAILGFKGLEVDEKGKRGTLLFTGRPCDNRWRSRARGEAWVNNPDVRLEPDSIAKAYQYLTEQDRSAWTWELDLRPAHEKW